MHVAYQLLMFFTLHSKFTVYNDYIEVGIDRGVPLE